MKAGKLLAGLLIELFVILLGNGFGQTAPDLALSTGSPTTIYHGTSLERVDATSGNLRVSLPLLSLPGRGLDLGIGLYYNSKVWTSAYVPPIPHDPGLPPQAATVVISPYRTAMFGWSMGDGRMGVAALGPDECQQQDANGNCMWTLASGTWMQNDGTVIALYRQSSDGGNTFVPPQPDFSTSDGSFALFTARGLIYKDGITANNSNPGASPTYQQTLEDTNGNLITCSVAKQSNIMTSCTDAVGRTITTTVDATRQFPQTLTYLDSSGVSQTIAFSYDTFTVKYPFGGSTSNCIQQTPASLVAPLLTKVTLANGLAYRFDYLINADGSTTGELTKIILPTGGYIRYTYDFAAINNSGLLDGCGSIQMIAQDRVVTHRFVSPDGTTASEQPWSYSFSHQFIDGKYSAVVNIGDPQGGGQMLAREQDGLPLTHHTDYIDSSGSVVKTIKGVVEAGNGSASDPNPYGYSGPRYKSQTTILVDTGLQSQTIFTYGPYNNVVEKDETAWGQGSPGGQLRKITYAYWHAAHPEYAGETVHILDRVSAQTVCDAAASFCAQTTTKYDSTTITGTTNIVQHDPNFSSSRTQRGNPTEINRTLGGVNLTTTNTYNDVGNLIQMVDPAGNSTSFSFADNYSGFTPAQPTSAYLTQTTLPATPGVSHTQRFQYYFNTGLPSATCGENFPANSQCRAGLTAPQADYTSFTYDRMGRPATVARGDGGGTSFTHSEGSLPISITSTTMIDSSHNLIKTSVYDGLGRQSQTQLNSDPLGVDFVDTTYDSLGRVSAVSNPHRTSVSSSDGVTQTQYDALGRVKQITRQDGSIGTVSYFGNCTISTDEALKSRKACSDALGRLTEVDEPGGSATGSAAGGGLTISGSLQTKPATGSTPGTGSVSISGTEQSKPGTPATTATGSLTITGTERSVDIYIPPPPCEPDMGYCPDGTYSTIYDTGTVVITVNGHPDSTPYGYGSNATSIATGLANAINSDGAAFVYASASNGILSLQARQAGASGNYSWGTSSSSSDPGDFGIAGAFSGSPTSGMLSGGANATPAIYDHGSCTVNVNGTPYSRAFSQGDTTTTIASGLASTITGGPLASATASGATVSLAAKTTGAATNYSLSSSCSYDSSNFTSSSFSAMPSGSGLTGGSDGSPAATDAGTVAMSIAGYNATANYGNGTGQDSTASAVASDLVGKIQAQLPGSNPPFAISVAGAAISINWNSIGPAGNVTVTTTSTTTQTAYFSKPSFASCSITSNPQSCSTALSGGADPILPSLNTPNVTLYQYDALGNLRCVHQKANDTSPDVACTGSTPPAVPAAWRQRFFTYDALSRLVSASNPESGTINYTYDGSGNLLQMISPAPNAPASSTATQTLSYCYDALNRVTGKAYSAQTCTNGQLPAGTAVVSYTYDQGVNGIGRMTSLTDQAGSASYAYDIFGRTATEQRTIAGVSKTVSYEYNLDGSLKVLHYPSGAAVTYTLASSGANTAGRMGAVQDIANGINYVTGSSGPGSYASYAADGSLTGFLSGYTSSFGGITNSFNYNSRLQPVFISASLPNQSIFSIGYDFHLGNGDNGNIFAITDNRDHGRDETFTYDALNRLVSAQNAGTDCNPTTLNGKTKFWGNGYTYDAWGNLIAKGNLPGSTLPKCNPESMDRTADAQNRLHVKVGADFQYDAAGNMTYDTGGQNYSYDAENRITGAGGYTYTYDADGHRVKKSTGTNPPTGTLYWYMSPGIVAESDLNGIVQSEYVFFNGRRVARRDGVNGTGGVFYYFSDRLKTTAVITNSTGPIMAESDYYPWGGELQYVNNDSNHYKYTGNERDERGSEPGLDLMGLRHYSNALGRFTRPDPEQVSGFSHMGDPQSWNGYSYARNNPVVYFDPDGQDYRVCDNTGKECANLTDDQFKQWMKDNPSVHQTGDSLYYSALGVDPHKIGSATYFNPADVEAAAMLVHTGAVLSSPKFIAEWYGVSALGGLGLYAAGAFEGGLVTLGLESAETETVLTGQMHHGISRVVYKALQRHPNLRNIYKLRDSRFVTQAKDLASHNGYQTWHRQLDEMVARWIADNPGATAAQFESYLNTLYKTAELIARFPKGF